MAIQREFTDVHGNTFPEAYHKAEVSGDMKTMLIRTSVYRDADARVHGARPVGEINYVFAPQDNGVNCVAQAYVVLLAGPLEGGSAC